MSNSLSDALGSKSYVHSFLLYNLKDFKNEDWSNMRQSQITVVLYKGSWTWFEVLVYISLLI